LNTELIAGDGSFPRFVDNVKPHTDKSKTIRSLFCHQLPERRLVTTARRRRRRSTSCWRIGSTRAARITTKKYTPSRCSADHRTAIARAKHRYKSA
jgi:hypothetical protein